MPCLSRSRVLRVGDAAYLANGDAHEGGSPIAVSRLLDPDEQIDRGRGVGVAEEERPEGLITVHGGLGEGPFLLTTSSRPDEQAASGNELYVTFALG